METLKNEKNLKNETVRPLRDAEVPHCPFIHSFLAECYCTNMKSTKVEEAIYYCGANYMKCAIYRKLTSKDGIGPLVLDSLRKEDLI